MRAYAELIRVPGVVNVTASQLFARLPLGMLSLAILLHVQARTGSFAVAGAVVACTSIGEAIAMPMTSRLLGRIGMVPTLVSAAVVNGICMLALAFVHVPGPVLMGLGFLIGASVPPLLPAVRSLYPQMVPGEGLRALFALDTTAQELIWVIGPVAATFLASAISTAIPLLFSAGVTVVGTAWFLLSARRLKPRIDRSVVAFGRVLINPAVILAMVASLALVASFMALEVGVLALFGNHNLSAGVALGVASLGSLIGGVLFGHRHLGVRGLATSMTVVAAGTAVFGLVDGWALQLTALFASGLGFAPALAALYVMVSREIAEHSAAEAFGWLNSGALVGGAMGTAIGGVVVDSYGSFAVIMVSAALALLAACTPLVARTAGPVGGLSREKVVCEI
ncbi:MFS transporter [Mycobacterium crocinum]|uniref:MFS transporter n=1 Tax=Mycolicibacterium crocinum TaxID=388459 RepID=A0ABY3TS35_9MYCO|nr:MFS transporter [Mycolicibacterium crocinum]MCV7218282.1 MFS transporter [Mycolicibacterium crocinum]ULN43452.1 MFS transporter [Mycolicibacterium crocinum]